MERGKEEDEDSEIFLVKHKALAASIVAEDLNRNYKFL